MEGERGKGKKDLSFDRHFISTCYSWPLPYMLFSCQCGENECVCGGGGKNNT